jgi:hypothetical protein
MLVQNCTDQISANPHKSSQIQNYFAMISDIVSPRGVCANICELLGPRFETMFSSTCCYGAPSTLLLFPHELSRKSFAPNRWRTDTISHKPTVTSRNRQENMAPKGPKDDEINFQNKQDKADQHLTSVMCLGPGTWNRPKPPRALAAGHHPLPLRQMQHDWPQSLRATHRPMHLCGKPSNKPSYRQTRWGSFYVK